MAKIVTFTNALSSPSELLKAELQDLVNEGLVVWENYDMVQDKNFILSYELNIRTFPTVVFYNDEGIKTVINGFIPRDRILEFYEEA